VGLGSIVRRLISSPTRVAYTASRVLVESSNDLEPSFVLAGWRDIAGGGAFQPSRAWDAVTSGGRNRRLDPGYGVSAEKERIMFQRWGLCIREGARPEPLAASCAVELRDVVPDLYQRDRIRGECVALSAVWLRPAPGRCEQCRQPLMLTIVRGVDADYLSWSCEAHSEPIDRATLIDALADRYHVPVEFD